VRKILTLVAGLLICSSPVLAQRCTALKVVGSGFSGANKSISAPSTLVTSNNWNTDFIVPSGVRYKRYTAKVLTDTNGQYDLKMVLKYNDGSSKVAFEQPARAMGVKDSFSMSGKPKSSNNQPYQINVLTGGTAATGKVVTVKVNACK
jgi:hypothetical protein